MASWNCAGFCVLYSHSTPVQYSTPLCFTTLFNARSLACTLFHGHCLCSCL